MSLAKINMDEFYNLVAHTKFEFDQDILKTRNFADWQLTRRKYFSKQGRLKTINDFVNAFEDEFDQNESRELFQQLRIYCHDTIFELEDKIRENKNPRFRKSKNVGGRPGDLILLEDSEKEIIDTAICFWYTDQKPFYIERTRDGICLPDSWAKPTLEKTKFNSLPNKSANYFMHQALYGTVSPDTVISNGSGSFAALYESKKDLKKFLEYEISCGRYNIRKSISSIVGESYKLVKDVEKCMKVIESVYSKILGEYEEVTLTSPELIITIMNTLAMQQIT